jgi:hypothetical protein
MVNLAVCETVPGGIVTRTPPQFLFCASIIVVDELKIIANIASRYASESGLAKGDILKAWMKRGDWWSEMRRGVQLEVKDVKGDIVTVNHYGWATSGWDMKLPAGQDLSKKFNLTGDARFRRALVVEKV